MRTIDFLIRQANISLEDKGKLETFFKADKELTVAAAQYLAGNTDSERALRSLRRSAGLFWKAMMKIYAPANNKADKD